MDIRKLNSSPFHGTIPNIAPLQPHTLLALQKQARYSVPNPNATGDSRLCSGGKEGMKDEQRIFNPTQQNPQGREEGQWRVYNVFWSKTTPGRVKAVFPQEENSGNTSQASGTPAPIPTWPLFTCPMDHSSALGKTTQQKDQRSQLIFLPFPASTYLFHKISQFLAQ